MAEILLSALRAHCLPICSAGLLGLSLDYLPRRYDLAHGGERMLDVPGYARVLSTCAIPLAVIEITEPIPRDLIEPSCNR